MLAGRVALIADFRPQEEYGKYRDGRVVNLGYSHAAGIDSLMKSTLLRGPSRNQAFALMLFVAALGLVPAYFSSARLLRRVGIAVALAAVILGVALCSLWKANFLFDPLIPPIALILSCELAGCLERSIRQHRHT
jgi:CHASE2 domain-containing sensor protein